MNRRDVLDGLHIIGGIGFIVTIMLILCMQAYSMDHGFDKNDPFSQWAEGLRQPPNYVASCCGKGDMYGIRIVKQATGETGGQLGIAVVTDGDAITFPDGTQRPPIANGTQFKFPKSVVNERQGNPTFSAFAFLSNFQDEFGYSPTAPAPGISIVYCVIPEARGV